MSNITWTPEQIAALDELKSWAKSPFVTAKALSGVAGSGKSTLLGELKKHLPGDVAWAAMTGKAALRLSEAAGVDAGTLHSILYKPPFNKGKTLYFSEIKKPISKLVVLDESSMTSPKVFEDLQKWQEQGVKILFVGDGVQLPPILSWKEEKEYGSDFTVFKKVTGPNLTKVMRSGDGIIEVASEVRTGKRFPTKGNDSVKIERVRYPGVTSIRDYLDDRDDHVMITWTNKMRMQGNAEVRRKLGIKRPLPEPGEPVAICKNGQGKLNGEIVYPEGFEPGPEIGEMKTHWMRMKDGEDILVSCTGKDQFFDGSLPDIKDWRGFHIHRREQKLEEPTPVTYGYVHTAHRMQGSQARRVTVYLSENDLSNQHFTKSTSLHTGEEMPFSMRWLYTSFTRAMKQLTFYYG